MLKEFNDYLTDQIGQPYVWGGQHTKLTPENYKTVIRNKENSEEHAKAAIAYCEKKFSEGATVLYAYDCSGLGMYWLQNVKGIYKADANANNELCGNANVEWYDCVNGEKTDKDYHSAIWIPVKKKA